MTTLYQSVERALTNNPQLQALVHNNEAIGYDLKKARARYLPSIDLLLGYGAGQHSDRITRLPEADPSDTDWNSRGDATLRLTQKVYDGGETNQLVSIQQAILDSANFDTQDTSQAIALKAINAHLDVYRQRELVALADKDLAVHQDIFRALSQIEKAGAGNIADVTQTQTRMARAQAILILSQGGLSRAISNYERVVGMKPGELAFAENPERMPENLEEALARAEQKNPGLLAFNARITEAEARVDLARSAYMPKLNVELNSRYYDQLEGDPSWQYTNDAMLVLRWNLFNGGQDKEATNAALSRKYESRSNRDDKLLELREATASAWTTYLSLQRQKKAFQEAVASSEKTFDAYLEQYSVSRRSLLDVLNAEKEYFQSARGLVDVSVDEIITAYRILNLGGALQVLETSHAQGYSQDLHRLSQTIVLPSKAQSSRAQPLTEPLPPAHNADLHSDATQNHQATATKPEATSPTKEVPLGSLQIGPCNNQRVLEQAMDMLHSRGFEARQASGTGMVKVTRLLEGVYPKDEAYRRLTELKQTVDAFVMPEEGELAIYVGSFHEPEKAIRYAELLAEKEIDVTPVAFEVELQGKILIVQPIDRQTAEMLAGQVSGIGLTANVLVPASMARVDNGK